MANSKPSLKKKLSSLHFGSPEWSQNDLQVITNFKIPNAKQCNIKFINNTQTTFNIDILTNEKNFSSTYELPYGVFTNNVVSKIYEDSVRVIFPKLKPEHWSTEFNKNVNNSILQKKNTPFIRNTFTHYEDEEDDSDNATRSNNNTI